MEVAYVISFKLCFLFFRDWRVLKHHRMQYNCLKGLLLECVILFNRVAPVLT